MWKWKEPIQLKCIKPMRMYFNALNSKIPANYQFMYCRMDAEELLHVLSLPPEFMLVGGNQEQIFQNNLFHSTKLQIEFINQFINRINLEGREYVSYQDRVFITAMLNHIGITNQQGFIRQLRLLRSERSLLLKLSGSVQKEIRQHSLENTIYKRINQTENMKKIYAFLKHSQTVKDSISFQEAVVLEQQRQIDSRVLTELKEKILKTKENISLIECGVFTIQKEEKERMSEQEIIRNLSATILLNLADMAHCILSKKEKNSFLDLKDIICSSSKLYAETFFSKNKRDEFSEYKIVKQLNQTKEILAGKEEISTEEISARSESERIEYSLLEKEIQREWESKEYLDQIDQKNKEMYRKIQTEIQKSEDSLIIKANKTEIRKQALRALENQDEVLKEALSKKIISDIKVEKEIEKYLLLTDDTTREFYHKLLNTLNMPQERQIYVEANNNKENNNFEQNSSLETYEQNNEKIVQKRIEGIAERIESEKTGQERKEQEQIEQKYQESLKEILMHKENSIFEQNSELETYEKNNEKIVQKRIEGIAERIESEKTEQERTEQEQIEQEYQESLKGVLLHKENNSIEQNSQKIVQKRIEEIAERIESEQTEQKQIEKEYKESFKEVLLHKENNSIEQNSQLETYEQNSEKIVQKRIEEIAERIESEKTEQEQIEKKYKESLKEVLLYKENESFEQTSRLETYEQNSEKIVQKRIEGIAERIESEKTKQERTKQERTEQEQIEKKYKESLKEVLLHKENNNIEQNSQLKTYEQNNEKIVQKRIEGIAERIELKKTEQERTEQERTEQEQIEKEYKESLKEVLLHKENNSFEQNSQLETYEQNNEKIVQKRIEGIAERIESKKTEQEYKEVLKEVLQYKENNSSKEAELLKEILEEKEKSFLKQNEHLRKYEQNNEKLIQKRIEERTESKEYENTERVHTEQISSLELVHKPVKNDYDGEEIKKLLEEQITNKKTITETHIQNGEIKREEINKITQESILQNQKMITEIISGNMQAQVGQLTEQVYHKIEKRLQSERKRRGF